MTAQLSPKSPIKSLYEADFYLWINTTIDKIRQEDFASVDWANVLEELTDLGSEQKHKLESRLLVLLEHLLKLGYWETEREYNKRGWKGTILEQRRQIAKLIKRNPSLKPYLTEIFAECYQDARDITLVKTGLNPDIISIKPMLTLEQALDENWLPVSENP